MKNDGIFKRILSGLSIGAVNGLFGGGGGMVAVPVLENLLSYPAKQAHATAIFIIAPVCAVSALTYLIGGYADLQVLIPAAIGNVAGGLVGAKLLGRLPRLWVSLAFIAVMLSAGIRMVLG